MLLTKQNAEIVACILLILKQLDYLLSISLRDS